MNGNRIQRAGHWVPYKSQGPTWANRPENPPDESVHATDALKATVLGQPFGIKLVSPRSCTVTSGTALAETNSGQPALVRHAVQSGQTFLLGFCLQDTYFQTWEEDNPSARAQLRNLLHAIADEIGVRPHVYSSNAGIEAALRANDREGFLFVINHEAQDPSVKVQLRDLPFKVGEIVNLEDSGPVAFTNNDGTVGLDLSVPLGEVLLLNVRPERGRPK
jgi:cytosine/adenosine deaminase-related metal-dependent hydrolase